MHKLGKQLLTGTLVVGLLAGGGLAAGALKASAATSANTEAQGQQMQGGPHWGMKRGGDFAMRGGNLVEESATVLGIDASALKDELQQGKTLAEIAKAKGLTEEVFLQKLEAAEKTRIASAVSSGKITQAQADKMLSGLADRLKQQIENNHPQHDMRGGRRGGPWGDHQALAKVLGMTADELQTQLQSGKSLAEIAQAKGISEDQLITKIKDGMTDQLKRFVEQKGMPGHMQPPAGQQNNAQ